MSATPLASTVGGGWSAGELAEHQWRLPVPDAVADELTTAARRLLADGATLDLRARRPAELTHAAAFARELHRRLSGDPGFVVLTGFPVDGDERLVELAYWTLGLLLGRPVSQSRKGDLLGRVEDRGADISSPTQRGYESSAALPFHADRTDVIGLLCVRPAQAGGLSRLVSSRRLHDLILAEHPELLTELYRELPNDRRGEEAEGQAPWTSLPVFSRTGDCFAARYVRRFIEGSQRHDGAPRLTAAQVGVLDALDALLERPGLSLDMELRRGDLQLINNFHILHARSAFHDGGGRGRLLLRLWLAFAGSPGLPDSYGALYGATAAGSYRGGVWAPGTVPPFLGRPVQDI